MFPTSIPIEEASPFLLGHSYFTNILLVSAV